MQVHQKENPSNPFNHVKHKSKDVWYLYWLYEDPDFQQKLIAIRELVDAEAVEVENGKYDSAAKLRNESFQLQLEIKKEFHISDEELDYIFYSRNLDYSLDFPMDIMKREADGLIVKIPFNILREDYMAAWDELSGQLQPGRSGRANLRNPPARRRSSDEPQLVYAIIKARNSKLKFREIFSLYQKGMLPMYENQPTNNYASQESLQQLYYRNKPVR